MITKTYEEIIFQNAVFHVFNAVPEMEYMFIKDNHDPKVNLFIALHIHDSIVPPLLFSREEVALDNNDLKEWAENTNHLFIHNEKLYYLKLLKTFIEYKKECVPDWTVNDMITLLFEKNRKYGNAILNPKKILSKSVSIKDIILSRIDEKISRLIQDNKNEDEDIITDIIGYLVFINIILWGYM